MEGRLDGCEPTRRIRGRALGPAAIWMMAQAGSISFRSALYGNRGEIHALALPALWPGWDEAGSMEKPETVKHGPSARRARLLA